MCTYILLKGLKALIFIHNHLLLRVCVSVSLSLSLYVHLSLSVSFSPPYLLIITAFLIDLIKFLTKAA